MYAVEMLVNLMAKKQWIYTEMLLQHGSPMHLNELAGSFVHCTFEFQTVSIMGTLIANKVSKLYFISQCFFLDEASSYLAQLELKCLCTCPLLEKISHEVYGLYDTQSGFL